MSASHLCSFLLALSLMCVHSRADENNTVVGDVFWGGRVGVGVDAADSRMEVRVSTRDEVAFVASGVDLTPFFLVSTNGAVGLGVKPSAELDISGHGLEGHSSLVLTNGVWREDKPGRQIAFGAFGTDRFSHSIRSVHSQNADASHLDFIYWEPGVGDMRKPARVTALSLRTRHAGSGIHVLPVGYADVELAVSNGREADQGIVHRRFESAPLSLANMSQVRRLLDSDYSKAYEEISYVRHLPDARGKLTLVTGSWPARVRRFPNMDSLDERVAGVEMATRELIRRLETLERQVSGGEVRP